MLKEKILKEPWACLVMITILITGASVYFIGQIKKFEKQILQIPSVGINSQSEQLANEIEPPDGIKKAQDLIWQGVTVFTGNENKKTEPFIVNGKTWKMTWNLERYSQKPASFSVDIYKSEKNEFFDRIAGSIPLPEESSQTTYSETFLLRGEEKFYLDVSSENIKNWEIKILEGL